MKPKAPKEYRAEAADIQEEQLRAKEYRARWDGRFMGIAKLVATWSKDPSTQCGAVIVRDRIIRATGYNGFPKGVADTIERLMNRPTKYALVAHAELNAVLQAGHECRGSTIYIWPFMSCQECAKAIIQSGIECVVCAATDDNERSLRWSDSHKTAMLMYKEAGVQVRVL